MRTRISHTKRVSIVCGIVFLLIFSPFAININGGGATSSLSVLDEEHASSPITKTIVFAQEEIGTADSSAVGTSVEGGASSQTGDVTNFMYCGIQNGSAILGCFGMVAYHIIYRPSAFLLAVIGNFFDIVLLFSISPKLIGQDFVKVVWSAVRDLANMAFIFILLWISIATILRVRGSQAKDILVKLIIVALLVNFSLFVTRVIVDVGNMFSMFFYEGFEVQQVENAKHPLTAHDIVQKIPFVKNVVGDVHS